ncbi:hypothetical protein ES705_29931 [subsurface metagenome]
MSRPKPVVTCPHCGYVLPTTHITNTLSGPVCKCARCYFVFPIPESAYPSLSASPR